MENPNRKLYNKAKAKLLSGQQVFSFTQSTFNTEQYCQYAPHYDFVWFEMQHSTLRFDQVQSMMAACPVTGATPMIRMPDALEANMQKAYDLGVLGTIVPTVDDVLEARDASRYAHFPPQGRRSQGGGQYRELWGNDYRQTANDNMMVVIMIETPEGVANAQKIAAVPGIDVIFAASTDLGNFSGHKQGEPAYEALVRGVSQESGSFRALGPPGKKPRRRP